MIYMCSIKMQYVNYVKNCFILFLKNLQINLIFEFLFYGFREPFSYLSTKGNETEELFENTSPKKILISFNKYEFKSNESSDEILRNKIM